MEQSYAEANAKNVFPFDSKSGPVPDKSKYGRHTNKDNNVDARLHCSQNGRCKYKYYE